MDIIISHYQSPVGEMLIGSYGNALCICDWLIDPERRNAVDRRIQRHLNAQYMRGTSDVIERAIMQLDGYFAGQRKTFDIPLTFAGTEFQCSVWNELMTTPYGITRSYTDIANQIHRPKAIRAVASAIASNPISILVPCHRVIGSNHTLTGYAGGLEAKHRLLALENVIMTL